jgi:hypothetical protein
LVPSFCSPSSIFCVAVALDNRRVWNLAGWLGN